jgi:hypothetical protein
VPASRARAEVTRVDVKTRSEIGSSGVEKIVGTAHFEVDPKDPRNGVIADIDKAPVNAAGRVEFSADFYALRPKDAAKSNDIALVDVVNRGRKTVVTGFARGGSIDPQSDADLGDRFLLERGFTLVWVGWEFDVRRQNGLMGITVPSAQNIDANVWGDFVPANTNERQTVGDLVGYTAADPGARESMLTVRDSQFGPAEAIDRSRWSLDGNMVTLHGGFEAGRIYRLSYRAKELPVSGLGLAAFRDIASWVKHSPDALVHARQTLAFGSSQSGRFLRTFLYNGLNGDEKGRQVFDAVWVHIAGAASLDVNARGATPTSLTMYEITRFPYANQATRDPITGRTDGLLENDRARQFQPKTFFTNTSVEYWGGGRNAALVHTAPDGKSDLTLADNTRVYYLTGAQHGPARFPTTVGQGQQPDNPLEYVWTMRALMSAMEQWMRNGTAPPPSQYPPIGGRHAGPGEHGGLSGHSRGPVADDRRAASTGWAPGAVPRAAGRRGRQRTSGHPYAGTSGPARDVHRLELPQLLDWRHRVAGVAAGLENPVPDECRRRRLDPRPATADRRPLPVAGRLPRQCQAGR